MRVIAGRYGGRKLGALGAGDAKAHLRPTTDRVREALFATLQGGRFGDPVSQMHVLDLFAGTGALGIEALSRGARSACFVEKGRKSLEVLGANLSLLGITEAKVLRCDATRLPKAPSAAGLVFLDPPYGLDLGGKALGSALAKGWIAPSALVVWEEASAVATPEGFTELEHRRYGGTHVTFLRAHPA